MIYCIFFTVQRNHISIIDEPFKFYIWKIREKRLSEKYFPNTENIKKK